MLNKQQKYMRLRTDDDLQNLSREEIMAEMSRTQHVPDHNKSLEALKLDLAALQRTRTLAVWHATLQYYSKGTFYLQCG